MKLLGFVSKTIKLLLTELVGHCRNVSLFSAERSEIEKRLFLCGRIAQYWAPKVI